MKRPVKLQAGMSMLEIMVTMFLVLIGLLVVMTSFVAIARAHRFAERMDVATSLACLEMERVRNQPFALIANENGEYGEYTDHPDFRHQLEVRDLGATREVTLRIFFERDRRRAEVMTIVSNL